MELDSLIIKIQASAEGVDAGIQQAKTALQGLDSASAKHLAETKKVAAGAADAYRLAAMEAQAAAIKVKTANDDEKAAFEAAAREAEKKAAILKIAAQEAQLAADQEARAFQSTADAAGKATVAYAAMAAAAAKAFQVIVQAAGTGIAAYNEQITVQQKLSHVMGNTMGARSRDVASINQLITAQEKLGVVSKSAQTAGAQELATYLTMGSSLQTLIPVMNDMAAQQFGIAASAEQVTNIATMLGKVMDGQVGGLSRYGYSFTEAQEEILKTGTEMERVAVLADVVSGSVGGMNEALAQTDAGKMEQASRATGDFSEALGGSLSPAAGLAASMLSAVLSPIIGITQAAPGLASGVTIAAAAFTGLMAAQKAADALKQYTGAATLAEAASKALGAATTGAIPGFAAVAVVIGVVVGAYTALKKAQEEEARILSERKEKITQLGDERDEIRSLTKEYDRLSSQEKIAKTDKDRLTEIERILAEKYGMTTEAIRDQIAAMKDLSDASKGLGEAKAQEVADESRKYFEDLRDAAFKGSVDVIAAKDRITQAYKDISNAEALLDNPEFAAEAQRAIDVAWANIEVDKDIIAQNTSEALIAGTQAAVDGLSARAPEFEGGVADAFGKLYKGAVRKDIVNNLSGEFLDQFIDDIASSDVSGALETFQKDVAAALGPDGLLQNSEFDAYDQAYADLFQNLYSGLDGVAKKYGLTGDQMREVAGAIVDSLAKEEGAFDEAAKHSEDSSRAQIKAATQAQEISQEAAEGRMQANSEALIAETDATRKSIENNEAMAASIATLMDAGKEGTEEWAEARKAFEEEFHPETSYESALEHVNNLIAADKERFEQQQEEIAAQLERLDIADQELEKEQERLEMAEESEENAERLKEIAGERRDIASEQFELEQQMKGISVEGIEDIPAAVDPAVAALKKLEKGAKDINVKVTLNNDLKALAKEAKSAGQSFDQFSPKLKAWANANGLAGASVDRVIRALDEEGDTLAAETANMATQVGAQLQYWYEKKNAIESGPVEGRFSADGTDLMAEADAAIAILEALLALLGIAGGAGDGGGKKKGGGGGGGKKGGGGSSSPARAENKELEAQLKLLEQRKRMGEVNTRQEIIELERIQKMYTKNAEERLRLEDMIFEARAKLRDEEIAQLDKLNDGIITALRNRYEAQRKLEQQNLDASIKAWQTWADETVAAIQAQIDALDEAEKQEGRDEKEQKALRKIANLRMALLYETDEYARHELEKEIAREEEDLAKQRREWAREDEKERLQAQIEAVQAQAQAEQEALEAKKEALDEVYEERLKNENLQAEAERMLVRNNQQELVKLIGSYAPEYEATGKSLGERLWAGMQWAMTGGISNWMDSFTAQIEDIQNRAAASANQMANQYYNGQLTGGLTGTNTPAPVTIEQTNNFNVPVPTPSAVREVLDETNEALAAQIAG